MNEITLAMFKGVVHGLLSIWYFWAFLLAFALIKLLLRLWETKRLADSGINEIDIMDGKTFEKYLEVLFRKLGYKVERTRYVGDYGADLVVWKNGIKTVIQAKRYKKNVGVKAIQEAVAAKGYYSCDKAMVVTNSVYTKQATELAREMMFNYGIVMIWSKLFYQLNGLYLNPCECRLKINNGSYSEVAAATESKDLSGNIVLLW